MTRIDSILDAYPLLSFVLLTFGISLFSFVLMLFIPNAQTPETRTGLPVWLIAIWSPNIAALLIWVARGQFIEKMEQCFSFSGLNQWSLIGILPLLIMAFLLYQQSSRGLNIEWLNFKIEYLFPLIFINLLMGPLGEELGWRAYMYPEFVDRYGWLAGAVVTGFIWSLWHAPLWLIDSPQSKIPYWAFSCTVVILSILMGMIYNQSGGSIIGVILLHLTFNISLGVIDILEAYQPGKYVIRSLFFYIPFTLLLLGIHEYYSRANCDI